ncbi:MAG: hypothetical protein HZA23_05745 [Nitrospirae bacterium]|nr:hypothetical protein [Nitrospirota bacterium]
MIRLRRRLWPVGIAVLVLGWCLVLPAEAVSGAAVEVRVIYGTHAERGLDPQLQSLQGELRPLNYSAYRLLDRRSFRLPFGRSWEVSLPDDRVLIIVPRNAERGMINLRVMVAGRGGTVVNTTLRLASGGTVIVGGPAYRQGVLILAVTARAQ